MKALLLAVVLCLSMPEVWQPVTPWDLWTADQVAQGLLISTLGALVWRWSLAVALVSVIFGLARTGCSAAWPLASDPHGSICDSQIGLPLTIGVLGIALFLVGRISRE